MPQMQEEMSSTLSAPRTPDLPDQFRRRSEMFAPGTVNGRPSNKIVWVYAVTGGSSAGELPGLTGVGGEPVRTVPEGGLHAVVSSVDATAFGEEALPGLLADLPRAETIGRAHHQVIESVAAVGPVVPLRLATIYPDDGTIRSLLAEHRTDLADLLATFRDTQEWGVKVYLEPRADGVPDGEPRWPRAEEQAAEIDRVLSEIALDSRRHPAPDLRLGPRGGWLVLNGVYLLSDLRAAEFGAVARHLAAEHEGLKAELSGPWPPYSFVDQPDA
ncbi:MAG TPA: GvpL/GvpF family gas vesicle protein [Streptosporangiaceae bacterium]|nr:GvpL/GvpF family gas vesicle protein [Streptosporangiaceae bacterium]